MTEAELQKRVFKYLQWALPSDAFVFHVPNGGKRSKAEAAILKGMGTTAGIPDIMIIYRGRVLGVELKSGKGTLSAAQRHVSVRLGAAGCPVRVCRSVDETHDFLCEYDIPLRARPITEDKLRAGFLSAMKGAAG